ncbi:MULTISPECIES: hypothetical protein [Aeromonas]|uniref:hypothetical protein n=1 Tax=Aeromonas TaxID=642 RepID=UPI0005383CEB|nr:MULTISPECIES: hypothetical protein [Aeromonas]AUZ76296.1 hypothetical protein C2U40_16575 [Aeromonas sp. ASNIH4]PNO52606.1 hypothetical protein MC69_015550 [Aeromonas hydrophila]POU33620.1 hypothetical protein C3405_20040 [Aeromonas hydrophila]POV86131.1 hypothetical protein C3395_21150 [Aeromonas sp. ASNIH6]HDX8451006.1 hypothetical protein [Aeromonas hydrophila]
MSARINTKLRERDIEIDFTDAIDTLVFDQMRSDQPNYHGIGEMHRVDFIVELDRAILFVEVKDPGNPKAQEKGLQKFMEELNNGTLSSTFASKFIDSFFYRWAEGRLSKDVYYLSLVTLEGEVLPNLSDEIAKKLSPVGKGSPRWQRHPVQNCQVFNIQTWNENFPKWPVTRLAAATGGA